LGKLGNAFKTKSCWLTRPPGFEGAIGLNPPKPTLSCRFENVYVSKGGRVLTPEVPPVPVGAGGSGTNGADGGSGGRGGGTNKKFWLVE